MGNFNIYPIEYVVVQTNCSACCRLLKWAQPYIQRINSMSLCVCVCVFLIRLNISHVNIIQRSKPSSA